MAIPDSFINANKTRLLLYADEQRQLSFQRWNVPKMCEHLSRAAAKLHNFENTLVKFYN